MKEALNFDMIDAEYEKPGEVMQAGTVLDLDIIRPKFDTFKFHAEDLLKTAKEIAVVDQVSLTGAVMVGGNAKRFAKAVETQRKEIILRPSDFVKGVNAICKVITDQLDEAEATVKEKIRVHNARIEMERRERERKAKEETEALQRRLDAEAAEANRKAQEEARKRAEKEERERIEKQSNIPKNITTKEGLLYRDGVIIDLPEADHVAVEYGFGCAEQMVKQLKKNEAAITEAIRKAEEEAKKNEVVAPTVVDPVVQEAARVTRTESGSASQRKVWTFEVMDEKLVPAEYRIIDEQLIKDAVRMGAREIPGVRIFEETKVVFRS